MKIFIKGLILFFSFLSYLLENFSSRGNKRGTADVAAKGRMASDKPAFGLCSYYLYTKKHTIYALSMPKQCADMNLLSI